MTRMITCLFTTTALGAIAWGGAPSAASAQSRPAATPIPPQALSHAGDYTFGYYPDGWRRPAPDAPGRFAVQTNRYAMLFNTSRARIERIGPVAGLSPEQAVAADNTLLNALPAAEVVFSVQRHGGTYRVASGAEAPTQLRLYRVGKYLQHFDLQTVHIGGLGEGGGLEGVSAWMEAYCWSDRLAMQLHLAAHESHLSPTLTLTDVSLAATVAIPAEYPIVEILQPDGGWTSAQPGREFDTAILMRNEAGAGIAVVAIPGAGQRVQFQAGHSLAVATGPLSLPARNATSFACVLVPSANVRNDALREYRQMRAAAGSTLQVTADGIAPYTGALKTRYDAVKGWHEVLLGENADLWKMERVRLANTDTENRTVRLNLAKIGGSFPITGMSPVLRDAEGCPVGLPVQISKNWHCAPPWFSGLAMLDVPHEAPLDLEFDLAYAHWGGVPAVSHAQLCLIGYANNQLWDQMAIGSFGESICYDPDVNLTRSMIDDVRPLMVWGIGPKAGTKWSWTHNVGGGDFLVIRRKPGLAREYLVRQKTLYAAYGPVLSDVTYAGQTADGAIQSRIRAQSWRSDDLVRALYTIRYDVTKPVEGIDRLAFFQLGADGYNSLRFCKAARGSAAGIAEAWDPPAGGLAYSRRGEKLEGENAWVGLFEPERSPAAGFAEGDQGAAANKAMIVRRWSARLSGKDCPLPHYSMFGSSNGVPGVLAELSPPPNVERLAVGDFVETEVEMVVLPQKAGDYYGPNGNLRSAMTAMSAGHDLAWREARCSRVEVKAAVGTVLQTWPVRIGAANGTAAEFTITGGVGYTPVTIAGVHDYRSFVLARIDDDGLARTIDESSPEGRDWWQAQFDPAARHWNLTFTLNLDTPGDDRTTRTFRWTFAQ